MKTPIEMLASRNFFASCCLKMCEDAIGQWKPGATVKVRLNAEIINADDVSVVVHVLSQYGWAATPNRQVDEKGKDCWAVVIMPKSHPDT